MVLEAFDDLRADVFFSLFFNRDGDTSTNRPKATAVLRIAVLTTAAMTCFGFQFMIA